MYDIGRHFFSEKNKTNERMETAASCSTFDDNGTERSERVDAKTTDVYRKRNETICRPQREQRHSLTKRLDDNRFTKYREGPPLVSLFLPLRDKHIGGLLSSSYSAETDAARLWENEKSHGRGRGLYLIF